MIIANKLQDSDKVKYYKECTEHEQEPITWHESPIYPTIILTWVLDREELEKKFQKRKIR